MKPLVFNYQHYEFSIGVLKKIDEILKDQSKASIQALKEVCEIMRTSGIREFL